MMNTSKIQGRNYGTTCKRCLILRVLESEMTLVFHNRYGGIAQLGEHLLCKQGVCGSIPHISTNNPKGLKIWVW